MQRFEYRVVPAPQKGVKAKGLKDPDARFAEALARTMNEMAAEGWEYQRAETLPCTESRGWFSGNAPTVYRNLLVFRRAVPAAQAAEPAAAPEPAVAAPAPDHSGAAAPDQLPSPPPALPPAAAQTEEPLRFTRSGRGTPRAEEPAQPAAPQPVLRAARAADAPPAARPLTAAAPAAEDAPRGGPVFRWPLDPQGAGTPPRPVRRGE